MSSLLTCGPNAVRGWPMRPRVSASSPLRFSARFALLHPSTNANAKRHHQRLCWWEDATTRYLCVLRLSSIPGSFLHIGNFDVVFCLVLVTPRSECNKRSSKSIWNRERFFLGWEIFSYAKIKWSLLCSTVRRLILLHLDIWSRGNHLIVSFYCFFHIDIGWEHLKHI